MLEMLKGKKRNTLNYVCYFYGFKNSTNFTSVSVLLCIAFCNFPLISYARNTCLLKCGMSPLFYKGEQRRPVHQQFCQCQQGSFLANYNRA